MANRGLSILQGTGPYRLFQEVKRFIFLFTLGLKKQWKQREMSCCRQNEKHPGSSPVYHGQKTENFKRITGTSKFISCTVDTGVFITLSMRSPPKKNSLLGPLTVTRDFRAGKHLRARERGKFLLFTYSSSSAACFLPKVFARAVVLFIAVVDNTTKLQNSRFSAKGRRKILARGLRNEGRRATSISC